MHANEPQNLQWLQSILMDEKHRATLRALLEQYELPVIEIGRHKSRQIRRGRSTTRIGELVNRAAI